MLAVITPVVMFHMITSCYRAHFAKAREIKKHLSDPNYEYYVVSNLALTAPINQHHSPLSE